MIKGSDMSPREIAIALEVSESTVIEDLKHIRKSGKYGELLIMPARCLKCGYEFEPKIKVPKRCPKCKSMWIEEPRFLLRQ